MTDGDGDAARELLRHTVATLAYRAGKVLRDAPAGFGGFSPGPTSRTASEILAHIGDLMTWALGLCRADHAWRDSPVGFWDDEVARFFDGVAALDRYLESNGPLMSSVERLFQGPVADALTHVGQLALMRRLAGGAVRGENYFVADIAAGRVGADQESPRREFD
jgi:hypothetical protein